MADSYILKLRDNKKVLFFSCAYQTKLKPHFGAISPFLLSLNMPYQATGAKHFLAPSSACVSFPGDSGQKLSPFLGTHPFF